ncbi:protein of unknown function [Candidatus Hydrogenisulfobacillus filiaventi]|uniref:FAD/NAD(P)-binding domain-containing protein n=1 Tax=Candidatus Hydrogenisulfobacillus filiaventi TaxID=2707344 RepID=A0A6F8ZFY3_9FIRM|nr:protein of unknown function [Candidatus Hydrogenisulfobacillus filiaventi]
MAAPDRVVTVGARIGGLAGLYWLNRRFWRGELDVTVVERWQDGVFRPELVHALDRSPGFVDHLMLDTRQAVQRRYRARWVHDTAVRVDARNRRLELAAGRPLPFDVLFLAPGVEHAWDATSGLGPELGGLCEAHLARHTATAVQGTPPQRLVLAAGPWLGDPAAPHLAAGFDMPLFEAALLWDGSRRRRRQRQGRSIRIVTPAPVGAEGAGPAGRRRLAALLQQRGIAFTVNARYRRVKPGRILLEDGEIPFDLSIWMPPYAGSRLARDSGLDDGYGWIPTHGWLRHPEWRFIFAIGDAGRLTVPKNGHQALVQARVAVDRL